MCRCDRRGPHARAAGAAAAARYVATNAIILAGWVRQGAAATAAAARVVAGWVLMGVQATIQAARMAAAWIISMGPIALVIAAVVGLVALVVTQMAIGAANVFTAAPLALQMAHLTVSNLLWIAGVWMWLQVRTAKAE